MEDLKTKLRETTQAAERAYLKAKFEYDRARFLEEHQDFIIHAVPLIIQGDVYDDEIATMFGLKITQLNYIKRKAREYGVNLPSHMRGRRRLERRSLNDVIKEIDD